MKDTTITVRVPRKLKEELAKYGVNVSEILRRALEEEVRKRKREELKAAAAELGEFFSRIPDEEIVKGIRETRDSR
ncbi:type II toxin-antitoxin system CcdA family antitoxin [Candidatus Bathyarchaeota archaeon]|nr:type II toxin-antitoxin system CcdA family antitoxin [Candidatus Bathyarchaeota archaeon]